MVTHTQTIRRCFPVNFVKFLREPFFMEHLSWLLLTCSALDVEGTLSMRDLLKHI